MFRTISTISFVVVLAAMALHFVLRKPKCDILFGGERKCRLLDLLRLAVFAFTLLFVEQKLTLLGVLRKLVFLLALLCLVVLVITGFVPRIFLGEQISGYWLMLHATAAPVFAACMAALAVMWADACRLNKNYWPWLNIIIRRTPQSVASPREYELAGRLAFWLLVVLALPVVLSAVLSMFPLFGTAWQEFLLQLHRYCTLTFALVAIIYLYLLTLAAMRRTAAR